MPRPEVAREEQIDPARLTGAAAKYTLHIENVNGERPTFEHGSGIADSFEESPQFTVLNEAPSESLVDYCTPGRQLIDADKLSGDLAIRFRRPGDRFSPMGLNGSRKLKDYFGDLGLPLEQRDAIPLLVCDDVIVWVIGHAISNEFAVTPSTRRLLQIEVSNAAE